MVGNQAAWISRWRYEIGKAWKDCFVGKDVGKEKSFIGWSHPNELLPRLLRTHLQYRLTYNASKAAARKLELLEPVFPVDEANPGATPDLPDLMETSLAAYYSARSFDKDGLLDELFVEQVLSYEPGQNVERPEGDREISLSRLGELFRPILHKKSIDESWRAERQLSAFLNSDSDYLVVTQNGKYSTMASRLTVLNPIVRTLVEKKQKLRIS